MALALIFAPLQASEAARCEPGLPHYRPARLSVPASAPYFAPDGRIRIVGYNDMAEMLSALATLFETSHPGFRFELILKGTRTAPQALADGTSLFAPMGAELEDAALAGYRAVHLADPLMIRVANDSLDPKARSSPVGIFVHRDNPLAELSLDQARHIFTRGRGRRHVTWGDLGLSGIWSNRKIHPTGFAETTAIGLFLRRQKFDGRPFVSNYIGKGQSRDVIEAVAGDPLAIGFANLSHESGQVKALAISSRAGAPAYSGSAANIRAGRYPLNRHLLVYARRGRDGAIDPVARAWLELILSCEGQRIIRDGSLGYIPLSPQDVALERSKLTVLKQGN
jgi:phosphate transport system substrate-binding protein